MSDIVVYEENDLMRGLLEEWLRTAGYGVRAAMPCAMRRTAGTPNLVIASLSSPKDTGQSVVREIQAAHPGVPVIALSGHFRAGLSANGPTAQSLGVQQVMAKPLTRAALLAAVRAMIGPPQ
jgi:DNA-binding response OmpR family regulator